MTLNEVSALIRDVPDFPSPGIVFKDITPLLADPDGFRTVIDHFAERVGDSGAEALFAIESRGFIFGAALASRLALPLHLVRKRGKLPRETTSIAYELEYGVDHLEVHRDALEPGLPCLVVDDVLATGGTAAATANLLVNNGGRIAAFAFVIELGFLSGRARLDGYQVESLITY